MNSKYIRALSCGVLCIGIASVLVFSSQSSGGRILFSGIIAWALLPYLVALGAAFVTLTRVATFVVILACILLAASGVWVYHDALYVHPDPQNELLLLFFPPIQLVGSIALLGMSALPSLYPPAETTSVLPNHALQRTGWAVAVFLELTLVFAQPVAELGSLGATLSSMAHQDIKWNSCNETMAHQLTAATYHPGHVYPYPVDALPENMQAGMPGISEAYVSGY